HRSVECQNVNRAEPEHRAQRERVERHANVVGKNLTRANLVRLIQTLPPMRAMGDDNFAKIRANSGEFREIRVMARSEEGNRGEQPEDTKSHCGVAPRPPKSAWKFIRKEVRDSPPALGIRAIDATVRANDKAVEIVDE